MTKDETPKAERLSFDGWHWDDPHVTTEMRTYTITCGYWGDDHEPMAAILWDGADHPVLIPKNLMEELVENGWEDTSS